MIAGLLVAGCGFALGRDRWEIAVWAAAGMVPAIALVVLAAGSFVVARSATVGGGDGPAVHLTKLAGDMRAGQTLRAALAAVDPETMGDVVRLARAGQPITDVLEAFVPHLGDVAPIARAALSVAASSGGSVSAALESLADQAVAMQDIERERRAALAPALMQASIVGGLPLVMLAWLAASGRLVERLAAGPLLAVLTIGGAAAIVVGAATVIWFAVRSSR